MDLDIVIRVDYLHVVTDKSTFDEKEFKMWKMLNRMCMIIMKRFIPETFKATMSSDIVMAKAFLHDFEKRFAKSEKSEIGKIVARLVSMKYKGKDNTREYIMEISHLA
ncbi:uncharacterized protein [Primulina huaijiensis]|uniref:uncharacterized protein n=1 Tax=Primulina huaijiensis TaxID=1492673 RepID=UPI003CC75140